ncbi:hypothetical protein RND71_001631 [Anisodus tanguticus]|uniref:Crossover junction endonuclease MUS81 n=1 Tax=Anisodus tanguticus TaxID=243964 RepID=A0AAE1SZP0_9SOLA|nr:hypothetical protein RND71_001631 [Anisodus tanguticus]
MYRALLDGKLLEKKAETSRMREEERRREGLFKTRGYMVILVALIHRCGLKKLIYVIEGDPNACTAAESIKTACFTTEILEGFDVQRTSGLGETLRKNGHLTQAINQHHRCMDNERSNTRVCPRFKEFIRKCEDLDKMTVSDVFAIQLMQVPQVTEEVAIAVLDMYPTLSSLASAYSLLDGDVCAQEEMLKEQSNNLVNAAASKNIFQLIWSS